MHLRLSEFYAQFLRPVGVYAAEYRLSDIRTRHAALLRFYDSFSVEDSCSVVFNCRRSSPAAFSDSQTFSFVSAVREHIAVIERVSFGVSFGLIGLVAPVDKVGVLAKMRFSDRVSAQSGVVVTVGPYVGQGDYQATSDSTAYSYKSRVVSVGLPTDVVVFGMRHLVDCFYGGLSFGGGPFAGRIAAEEFAHVGSSASAAFDSVSVGTRFVVDSFFGGLGLGCGPYGGRVI